MLATEKRNAFFSDICELLVVANIPVEKISNPISHEHKWCSKEAPSASTLLQYYVKPMYEKVIAQVRREIRQNWIYIQLDGSVISGRRFYSVIVGRLDGTTTVPMLLDIRQISENVNNINATQTVVEALKILWPDEVLYSNVRLLLTDQASYMIRAGNNLRQGLFSNLLHITCLCHALSRVCEDVRNSYPKIDNFVANLKNVVSRSSRWVALLEELTGHKLAKFPVLTRWGTWVTFCMFVCQHLEAIKEFATRIFDDECSSV